jgi:riboflavin-specific deaminase-like protein
MSKRPFVFVNMAMTVDGKITSTAREYPTFSSPHDRKMMSHLRAQADAVIMGAGTLRADDPPLHIRDPEALAARARAGKPAELWHIVVSRSLDVDPHANFFKNPAARRILVSVENAPDAAVRAFDGKAEVWQHGRDRVDLPAFLQRLNESGVQRLLLEGGAELNWEFLSQDLIDELHVTIAPALLGGTGAPTAIGGAGLSMAQQRRLRLIGIKQVEDELYCHYAVKRE